MMLLQFQTNSKSRVPLKKLINHLLVKIFLAYYGTRMFTNAFSTASHLSLSQARETQSMSSYPIPLRGILILSSHLRLGLSNCLITSGFHAILLYILQLCTDSSALQTQQISQACREGRKVETLLYPILRRR
jgi:hypothetical protein